MKVKMIPMMTLEVRLQKGEARPDFATYQTFHMVYPHHSRGAAFSAEHRARFHEAIDQMEFEKDADAKRLALKQADIQWMSMGSAAQIEES